MKKIRPRGATIAPVLLCFAATSLVPRAAQVVHRHAGAVPGHVHAQRDGDALSHLLAHLLSADDGRNAHAHGNRRARRPAEPRALERSTVEIELVDGRFQLAPLRRASRAADAPATARLDAGGTPSPHEHARPLRAATPLRSTEPTPSGDTQRGEGPHGRARQAHTGGPELVSAPGALAAHGHWQSPYNLAAPAQAPRLRLPLPARAAAEAAQVRTAQAARAPTRARAPPLASLS